MAELGFMAKGDECWRAVMGQSESGDCMPIIDFDVALESQGRNVLMVGIVRAVFLYLKGFEYASSTV